MKHLTPLHIARTSTRKASGCWHWNQSLQTSGYGQLRIEGKSWLAHRASWVAHEGPIPEGLLVLHKCDNTVCVNPKHLFLGTHKDNNQDMVSKNRHLTGFCKGHTLSRTKRLRKLTDEHVAEIRSSDWVLKDLADKFKVSIPTISLIKRGLRKNK